MTSKSKTRRYCDFCGKTAGEVEYLVAGPVADICEECVETCARTIRSHQDRQRGAIIIEAIAKVAK